MRLDRPPGHRSTDVGAPRWPTPPQACGDVGMQSFLASLPPTVRSSMRADLRRAMDRAKVGGLTFCTCTRGRRCPAATHDVNQSESRPRVLELRWKEEIDEDGHRAVARLCFTEPEHIDELTHLLFRAKYPDDPGWHAEQTWAMRDADDIITAQFEHPTQI